MSYQNIQMLVATIPKIDTKEEKKIKKIGDDELEKALSKHQWQ